MFQQSQPAAMFYTDDVKGDYERIKARGAEFTMPPTDVTASTIAMLNDTCGNLIQLTQLARYPEAVEQVAAPVLAADEAVGLQPRGPDALSTIANIRGGVVYRIHRLCDHSHRSADLTSLAAMSHTEALSRPAIGDLD